MLSESPLNPINGFDIAFKVMRPNNGIIL